MRTHAHTQKMDKTHKQFAIILKCSILFFVLITIVMGQLNNTIDPTTTKQHT